MSHFRPLHNGRLHEIFGLSIPNHCETGGPPCLRHAAAVRGLVYGPFFKLRKMMAMLGFRSGSVVVAGLAILLVVILSSGSLTMTSLMGGSKPVKNAENDLEIEEHAKFAVDEHNRQNQGANLCYKRVVSAKTQVVAGTKYHLTIEADSSEGTKLYDAQVWAKPWEKMKKLEEFKESSSKPESGKRSVPVDDPVVKEAAEHALKGLQQRSNSLIPYELQHVVEAQAEVSKDTTSLDLVLKVKRGEHEEHVNASVHRAEDGKWTVKNAHLQ